MLVKIRNALKNERGNIEDLVTSTLAILFSFIMIALMLNVWSSILTKWQLDQAVDQIARQIELAGACDENTVDMEEFFLSHVKCDSITFNVKSTFGTVGSNDKCIQLGTPFYVEATATTHIGGMFDGKFKYRKEGITYTSRSSGVSEKYWKELDP